MLAPICLIIIGFATMVQAINVYKIRGHLRNQGPPHLRVTIVPRNGDLDLSNSNLLGMEPGVLSGMNNVNSIDVSRNTLLNTNFFHSVPQSTKVIKAEEISIRVIERIDFRFCPQLSTISLGHNRLSRLSGITFLNVRNLRQLFLHFNRISSIDWLFFTNLGGLTTLDLSSNQIENLPNGVFANLLNIQEIFMDNNKLHVIRTNFFGIVFPRSLKTFDVCTNPLTVIQNRVMIFGSAFPAPLNSDTDCKIMQIPHLADRTRTMEISYGNLGLVRTLYNVLIRRAPAA